jgi:23S rRNA (guanosine2251-2'-O)-methyltransferase
MGRARPDNEGIFKMSDGTASKRPRRPVARWKGPHAQRPGGTGGGRPSRAPKSIDADDRLLIYGFHSVAAALGNPRREISKAWLTDNAARRLEEQLRGRDLAVETVSPKDLDRRLGADTVHQGALIETEPLPDIALDDLAMADGPGGPILALDQVTDPHNVGAILRSAAVFGARGVVMTRRHSPPLSGALAKAASGALDLVPVALVQNLARSLDELKAMGLPLIGLDGEAEAGLEAAALDRPCVLVLGAEGKGLRQLTRETCTSLVRIEASGVLGSLNVSNAAAIALHFAAFRRRTASG